MKLERSVGHVMRVLMLAISFRFSSHVPGGDRLREAQESRGQGRGLLLASLHRRQLQTAGILSVDIVMAGIALVTALDG